MTKKTGKILFQKMADRATGNAPWLFTDEIIVR